MRLNSLFQPQQPKIFLWKIRKITKIWPRPPPRPLLLERAEEDRISLLLLKRMWGMRVMRPPVGLRGSKMAKGGLASPLWGLVVLFQSDR